MSFRRLSIYAGAILIVVLAILFYIKPGPYMGQSQNTADELRGRKVPFKVAVVSADLGDSATDLPATFMYVTTEELLAGKAAGADVLWFVGEAGADKLSSDQVFASMMSQLVLGGQPIVVVDLPAGYDTQLLQHAFGLADEPSATASQDAYLMYFAPSASADQASGGEVVSGYLSLPVDTSTEGKLLQALVKSYEVIK